MTLFKNAKDFGKNFALYGTILLAYPTALPSAQKDSGPDNFKAKASGAGLGLLASSVQFMVFVNIAAQHISAIGANQPSPLEQPELLLVPVATNALSAVYEFLGKPLYQAGKAAYNYISSLEY